MKLSYWTVSIRGSGSITCQKCNKQIFLPDNARAILIDNGKVHRVISATDASLVHLCGRTLEWRCFDCNQTGEPVPRVRNRKGRLRRELDVTCPCGGTLLQREFTPQSRETRR